MNSAGTRPAKKSLAGSTEAVPCTLIAYTSIAMAGGIMHPKEPAEVRMPMAKFFG